MALVALLLLTALLLTFVGCTDSTDAEEPEETRFSIETVQRKGAATYIHIITDTETGAQYMMAQYGQGIGLTVLEPAPEEE